MRIKMLVTQLKTTLDLFFSEENDSQTLLIDGKWGCGKTYELKQYLKEAKDQYVYISLFGLKNYEEIVLRLAEFLDSSLVVLLNGHYYINTSIDDESKYNNCFIIFDDLERKDEQLSFSSILCVVDSLRTHGFKIICVTSSENIQEKGEFENFKDKVIDELYYVRGDYSVFSSVVKDLSYLPFEKTILEDVDDNWRIVKRAATGYLRMVEHAKKIKIKDINTYLGLSSLDLFRSCCIAFACYFINNDKTPEFGDDNHKLIYNGYKIFFSSESIVNNLYKFFVLKKENLTLEPHVTNILNLISNNDYDSFFNCYEIEEIKPVPIAIKRPIKATVESVAKKKKVLVKAIDAPVSKEITPKAKPIEDILNKEYFLLDDEGRRSYINSFFKNLNDFDFDRAPERKILNSVLANYTKEMSDDNKKDIIQRIVKTIPLEKSDDFMVGLLGNNSKKEVREIRDEIAKAFEQVREEKNKDKLSKLVEKKDYEALTSLLYNSKYSPDVIKNNLARQFKEFDYCLPDLSKETSQVSWTFCHEIARFVQETEYSKDFINNLAAKCAANPDSKSLFDKCLALAKYDFDISEKSFRSMIELINII